MMAANQPIINWMHRLKSCVGQMLESDICSKMIMIVL